MPKEVREFKLPLKGPCSDGCSLGLGDSTEITGTRLRHRVTLLCQGTIGASWEPKKSSIWHSGGYKAMWPLCYLRNTFTSLFAFSLSPHPELEKWVRQSGIRKTRIGHTSSFPPAGFWAWVRLGVMGYEGGERDFKLSMIDGILDIPGTGLSSWVLFPCIVLLTPGNLQFSYMSITPHMH